MTEASAAGPLETVVLIEEEAITSGGPAIITWEVPYNDGSVRAARHPSAHTERLDRGSGIVWRTRITLELPRGAVVTRLVSRPDASRRSALEHLTSPVRGAPRRSKRTLFRVGKAGALLEEPSHNQA